MLLVAGIAAAVAAQAEATKLTFTAEFGTPLLDPAPLTENVSATLHASLKVTNESHQAIRFSRFRSLLPEIVDAGGVVVPFDHGANGSREVTAADYPLLSAGQSLLIPLVGTLTLANGQLNWKGGDFILGFWKVSPTNAPYRLRLQYQQTETVVGPLDAGSRIVRGIWTGEAVTDAVVLPLQFAN